jgi:hypothetical protein
MSAALIAISRSIWSRTHGWSKSTARRADVNSHQFEELVTVDRADVLPRLQKMMPGACTLSHQFALKGVKADRTEVGYSEEAARGTRSICTSVP